MLASKTSYGQTRYSFDSTEVKKIHFYLQDRELLLKDTADYKLQIRNLKKESFNLRLAYESRGLVIEAKEYENNILLSDHIALGQYADKIESQNKKLRRKVVLGKYVIPISFGVGILTAYLLSR